MEFPLHLRHCLNRQHDTAAILIPGDNVSLWISAVQHFNVPSSQLRFLVVHENRESIIRTVGAVCVFPPGYHPDASAKTGCLNYGCLADRLFVPVEARLNPEISDDELDRLLPTDNSRLFVWHPIVGLIGFESEHVLSMADLLSPPPVSEVHWRDPGADEQINRQIRSLFPEPTPDLDDILNSGQDDIGSESDNLNDAPRAPDEKSAAAVRDGIQAFKRGIGKAVHKLTSKLPTAENGSRWLGRLHQWSESLMSAGGGGRGSGQQPKRPDSGISTRRENEIKRLLNMLQNDPDKGLKYALPMSDNNRGRGTADPTDRLAMRDMDFDPSRMYGSGRADAWDIPWEYQLRLINEYRQLAQREQKLGRYRRAAYIYARLLNDLSSSAAALEAGKYYHDAATIYIEHLDDPVRAAQCLRNGGFWEEAVQIYRNRERWIDAGELYEELERTDDAREMFRNAVQECEVKRNYAGAADIADKRLNDPELASELFVTGWMQAVNGRRCLQELMGMFGRRVMHANAMQSLRQATDIDYLGLDQINDALIVCSENAERYPDESVRNDSRKHCWRMAAALLSRNDEFASGDEKIALESVRKLAPADRLLQSDSQRFQMQKQVVRDSREDTSPSRTLRQATSLATFIGRYPLIPDGTHAETTWTQIVCNGSFLYRVGSFGHGSDLVVVQQAIGARRDGRVTSRDQVARIRTATDSAAEFRLRLDQNDPDQVWLFCKSALVRSQLSELQQAASNTQFLNTPSNAAGSSGLILDICGSSSGWLFSLLLQLDAAGFFTIGVTNRLNLKEGTLPVGAFDDTMEALTQFGQGIRLHTDGNRLYIWAGRAVIQVNHRLDDLTGSRLPPSGQTSLIETLPFPPLEMVASPSVTDTRLVFSFEEGARAVWPVQGLACAVAVGLASPILAFSMNGILAAACRQTHRIEFWRLNSGVAILHAQHQSSAPITHLTCGPAPNQILAFHADGSISQLSIPAR